MNQSLAKTNRRAPNLWPATRAALLLGWVPIVILGYWSRGFEDAPAFVLPVVEAFAVLTVIILGLAMGLQALRKRNRR